MEIRLVNWQRALLKPTEKRCTGICGEMHPVGNFDRCPKNADGRRSKCKACTKAETNARKMAKAMELIIKAF